MMRTPTLRAHFCLTLAGAGLLLACCTSQQALPGQDLRRLEAGGDVRGPDSRAAGDVAPGADSPVLDRDLAVDQKLKDKEVPQDIKPASNTLVVTSDKTVTSSVGYLLAHARWGTDHVLATSGSFYRISDTGTLLSVQALPKKSPPSPAFVWVTGLAEGKNGIAAVYDYGTDWRVSLVDPKGNFAPSNAIINISPYKIAGAGIVSTKTGFAVLYGSGYNDYRTDLRLLDAKASFVGQLVMISSTHFAFYLNPAPDGKISYITTPSLGGQHGLVEPDPKKPSTSLSGPLVSPARNLEGACTYVWHAMAPTGETFIAYGDIDTSKQVCFIAYNVENAGKAVFATEQLLTTPAYPLRCICDVATDGKRFVVIWAEGGPAPPLLDIWKWRGQVFDLKGNPLAQAQDLPFPQVTIDGATWQATKGQLIWNGKDFTLFYVNRWLYGSSLQMARLTITP